MLNINLQEAAQAAQETAGEAPEEKTLKLIDLLFSGGIGGTIIIIILFVLLAIGLYIYFERLFAIRAASKTDKNFMHQIRDNIANGNVEGAKIRCAQENSPVARLTEKGISRIGSPLEDINTAIENAGRLEVYKLEKNYQHSRHYCRCCADDRVLGDCDWYGFGFSRNGHQRRSGRNGRAGTRDLYCDDHNGRRSDSWYYCLYRL